MDGTTFPPVLRAFVERFAAGEYWESHEVLEGAWRATGSGFYQGLILLASAWVHVGRGNAHGVVAQLDKAARRLAPYRPAYLGVDVDGVLAHAAGVREAVAGRRAGDGVVDWAAAPAPELRLAEAHLRGDEPELAA